jgi:competence protein ComEC
MPERRDRAAWVLALAALLWLDCRGGGTTMPSGSGGAAGGGTSGTAGASGTTGSLAGTTGSLAGTTGSPAGTTGSPAGTTGSPAGTTGSVAGTTGSVAGTTGSVAGTSGTAGMAAGGGRGGAGGGTTAAFRIYWVDTEGGAATLLVAPTGQVVLVDAGFSGTRDPQRIADLLAAELGSMRIDALIVTHYHTDHVGGVAGLASRVTIGEYLDHGDSVEPGAMYDSYRTLAASGRRTIVRPGDRRMLGPVELTFVTSAGAVIDPPLPAAVANPHCGNVVSKSNVAGAENPQSVGFVAKYGTFEFVDLGDLTWNAEQPLACPTNRIGVVDLYQVSHHGMDLSSSPQLVHGLAPLVAVMNNGASKGGSASTFDVLGTSPGLQDVWALHRNAANDAAHNAPEALTANVDTPDRAFGLKAVIEADGTFTLTNARNGMSRSYRAR